MKKHWSRLAGFLVLGLGVLVSSVPGQAAGPYHLLKEIPVGGDGGWDCLTVDSDNHRLYVTHATKVIVIDTATDAVVGEIADTPGAHGVTCAPRLDRVFTGNGKENKASIVDRKTLHTIAKVDTGENTDVVLFEPSRGEVYAFNGRGQSATVFEAATGKVVATISLGGKPEFAQADPAAGRIYVNIEDKSEVVAVDTKTHQVVNHWPVAPGEEPTGLAFDPVHHRLMLGCSNEKVIILDSVTGKVVADLPAGPGIDGTEFDLGSQLLFAPSGGSGTVMIAHEDAPDKFTVVQTLVTERSARTIALDPATHRIYLPSARFEPSAPAVEGAPRARPKMIPGSFKVLVYGRD